MAFWSRKKSRPSPVQRLCGLCFALFVLLQTPLFTLPVEHKESGRVLDVPMSAAEVAAIGVISFNPEYLEATQLALVPGAWWKLACRQLFACLRLTATTCDTSGLLDGRAMLAAVDYSAMVEPYKAAAGSAAGMLSVSSGMLVVCALVMPVVPDLYVAVVGLGLFIWSIFQTACSPLPTTAFMGLLCVTAVFGPASKKVAAGAAAAGGAVAAAAPKANGSKVGGNGAAATKVGKSPGKKQR